MFAKVLSDRNFFGVFFQCVLSLMFFGTLLKQHLELRQIKTKTIVYGQTNRLTD